MRGRDAVATAEAVRNGETDARTVAEQAIARIEKTGDVLNAVIHTRFEAALDEVSAGLPDGPLHGVPMLVKDLGTEVAGLPATGGSRLFAEGTARHDSELVARYRRAGAVVLGTTNTAELGLNASTEPALFGPTRNPWNTAYSPGGSSGG
ncbi:amidase family protein, partial [Streptomyces sp. NRRL WC-3549]|uniref:amidase family protein n=1 Tax=Streptomyces sp. NRRL WC-3549 TaxID=1463925 RepID=UPI00056CC9EA